MISRLLNTRALCLLLSASLFSIMLLGGCPAAQTPAVPPQEEEEQPTQPAPTTPQDEFNRPVEQPTVDDETATSGPGGSVPTGDGQDGGAGGGGDQGGDGGVGTIVISIENPFNPLSIRPGTVVSLEFDVIDPTGSLESGTLLLARDADADGQADGDPVLVVPITIAAGFNAVAFNADLAAGLLTDDFGRFVLGVQATTIDDASTTAYSPATITIDAVAPTATWLTPTDDHLVGRDTLWTIELETTDNSPHSVRILLDPDTEAENGNEFPLVEETTFEAGSDTRTFERSLLAAPAGTYHYYVVLSDDVEPPTTFYAEKPGAPGTYLRLSLTNRLIGRFELEDLADAPGDPAESKGAILQGVNFNDLAGSSIASVPDLNGDGASELIIGARFGKPNIISSEGIAWGEAYLIYGSGSTRMMDAQTLDSVGGAIAGLTFRGIRVPLNPGGYTEGLSDVAVIDDMDGDDLPELVFSFPRAESVSLVVGPELYPLVPWEHIQHPELKPDEPGMGKLEYNAFHNDGDPTAFDAPVWNESEAQFTRGGIVIVSSQNEVLTDPGTVTRKFDRVLDLHEIGQMFNWMTRPSLAPYIRSVTIEGEGMADCDDDPNDLETEYIVVVRWWDVWLGGG